MVIDFNDHMSFGSPNGAHCLNPMRYYDASIENAYHRPPSNSHSIHIEYITTLRPHP